MKVIFLDFDGVINTRLYDAEREEIRYFFPEDGRVNNVHAVDFVNKLILDTDAVIVVSSTWRIGESITSLQHMLVNSGCVGKVIGKTENLSNFDHCERGDEIQSWLSEHEGIESYVIIDDNSDMLKSQMSNFVKCNEAYGFMYPEYRKALNILNN